MSRVAGLGLNPTVRLAIPYETETCLPRRAPTATSRDRTSRPIRKRSRSAHERFIAERSCDRGDNRSSAQWYLSRMPGRHSRLVVRIVMVPLIVLAPLGALAVFARLFPSAPDGLGPVLMMLYLFM
jgi:hypothetical protein